MRRFNRRNSVTMATAPVDSSSCDTNAARKQAWAEPRLHEGFHASPNAQGLTDEATNRHVLEAWRLRKDPTSRTLAPRV